MVIFPEEAQLGPGDALQVPTHLPEMHGFESGSGPSWLAVSLCPATPSAYGTHCASFSYLLRTT